MIKGIGIDIVEIKRIKDVKHLERFVKRILSKEEIKIYDTFQHDERKIQFLSGRFAAKEAYSKALGTGIGDVAFNEIIVINDEKGKPVILNDDQAFLSISHSDHYAVAQVIIET